MKAQISITGTLDIALESETELFAIKALIDRKNVPVIVQLDKFGLAFEATLSNVIQQPWLERHTNQITKDKGDMTTKFRSGEPPV